MDYSITRTQGDNLWTLDLSPLLFGYTECVPLSKFGILPTKINHLFDPNKSVMQYQLEVNGLQDWNLYACLCQLSSNSKFSVIEIIYSGSNTLTLPKVPTEVEYLALLPPMTAKSFSFDFTMYGVSASSGLTEQLLEWDLTETTNFFTIPNFALLDQNNTTFFVNGQMQNDISDYIYNNGGIQWVSTDFSLVSGMLVQVRAVYL